MRLAMLQRRHLAHRVDRQIGGLALLAGLHVQHLQVIRRAEFFEQDQRPGRARVRRMEERHSAIVGHPCLRLVVGWN